MTITVSASAVIEITERYTASLAAFTAVVKEILAQVEGTQSQTPKTGGSVTELINSITKVGNHSMDAEYDDQRDDTDALVDGEKPKRRRRTKAEIEAEAVAKTLDAATQIIKDLDVQASAEEIEEETDEQPQEVIPHFIAAKAPDVSAGQATSPTPARQKAAEVVDAGETDVILSTWENFRAEVMRINTEGGKLDKTFVPRIQKHLAEQFKVNKLSDVYSGGSGLALLKLMRTELAILKDKAVSQ